MFRLLTPLIKSQRFSDIFKVHRNGALNLNQLINYTRYAFAYFKIQRKQKAFLEPSHTSTYIILQPYILQPYTHTTLSYIIKFCGNAPFPHSSGGFARNYAETFPQNFHTRRLDQITVFYAVYEVFLRKKLCVLENSFL